MFGDITHIYSLIKSYVVNFLSQQFDSLIKSAILLFDITTFPTDDFIALGGQNRIIIMKLHSSLTLILDNTSISNNDLLDLILQLLVFFN
jgi:hypothetical protein